MEKRLAWSERRTLESDDVDLFHRLRPTALNKFLQEIAWNHAKAIGVAYDNEGFEDIHWVLVRLDIIVTGDLPLWGNTVRIHTQPSGIDKFFALREFILEVETNQGVREFCRATSSWVIIHGETRRIQKPLPFVQNLLLPETKRVLEYSAAKIAFDPTLEWTNLSRLRANYNDIDLHDHVNNGKYLEWFLSALNREFFATKDIARIELNFLSEVGWGETLENQFSTIDGTATSHRVLKVNSEGKFEQPSALGRISWRTRALHQE